MGIYGGVRVMLGFLEVLEQPRCYYVHTLHISDFLVVVGVRIKDVEKWIPLSFEGYQEEWIIQVCPRQILFQVEF